jgi:hypothetical protein
VEDNTITVYSILENVQAQGGPVFLQDLSVLAMLKRAPTDPVQCDLSFEIRGASKSPMTSKVRVDFQKGLKNRTVIKIRGLLVDKPGSVWFRLLHGGKEIASCYFDVAFPQEKNTPDVEVVGGKIRKLAKKQEIPAKKAGVRRAQRK